MFLSLPGLTSPPVAGVSWEDFGEEGSVCARGCCWLGHILVSPSSLAWNAVWELMLWAAHRAGTTGPGSSWGHLCVMAKALCLECRARSPLSEASSVTPCLGHLCGLTVGATSAPLLSGCCLFCICVPGSHCGHLVCTMSPESHHSVGSSSVFPWVTLWAPCLSPCIMLWVPCLCPCPSRSL